LSLLFICFFEERRRRRRRKKKKKKRRREEERRKEEEEERRKEKKREEKKKKKREEKRRKEKKREEKRRRRRRRRKKKTQLRIETKHTRRMHARMVNFKRSEPDRIFPFISELSTTEDTKPVGAESLSTTTTTMTLSSSSPSSEQTKEDEEEFAIYLGNQYHAFNTEMLQKLKITLVVNVSDRFRYVECDNVRFHHHPMSDFGDSDLRKVNS